ncbi:MAG: hypothetical protein KatS3mg040_1602 [Candidatus Kapaibacterium sp.]|nr:MAG: hypothetical protein KatS3mg040_1602 [Candidatus Kapabacteria bacterium]
MLSANRNELLIRAYYRELSDEELKTFEEMLERDASLREEHAKLVAMLEELRHAELPLPESESFWIGLEHSILHRIRKEGRVRKSRWANILGRWTLPSAVRIGLAFGSLVLVFIGGVHVGTRSTGTLAFNDDNRSTPPLLPIEFASHSAGDQPRTNEHLRSFLKRSQLYIATTADRDLACTRCIPIGQQLDHRQFARELLHEAQRLRPLVHRDPKVKKVLQDVELVLANLSQNPQSLSREQVEVLHNIASSTICEVSATIDNASTTESVSQP